MATNLTAEAFYDRVSLIDAMAKAVGESDRVLIAKIFGFRHYNKGADECFVSWHAKNWPKSSMARIRGPHILTLLNMKAIQLREEGIL